MTGRRLLACALLVVVGAAVGWLGSTEENRLYALAAESGRVVWSAGLPWGTRVAGVPAVAAGRVILGLGVADPLGGSPERWQMAAFDASGGRALWTYEPPAEQRRRLNAIDMVLTTPHATADRVFVRLDGADIASLLALDAATGQTAWTLDAPVARGHTTRHVDLVAHGGRVLVPVADGDGLVLRALDANAGTERWRVPLQRAALPHSEVGPFFAANADTFFVGLSRGILALDAATGATLYEVAEPADESGGQIALGGDTLYRRSGLKSVEALDAATGARRWSYRLETPPGSLALKSFAARDGVLAVLCACNDAQGRDRGALIAIDAASGSERWRATLDAYIEVYQTWPVQASGAVIEAVEHDDVVARNPADGATRWRFPRERGLGVAAADRLVYASDRAPRWRQWLRMVGVSPPS